MGLVEQLLTMALLVLSSRTGLPASRSVRLGFILFESRGLKAHLRTVEDTQGDPVAGMRPSVLVGRMSAKPLSDQPRTDNEVNRGISEQHN